MVLLPQSIDGCPTIDVLVVAVLLAKRDGKTKKAPSPWGGPDAFTD
jgi:hypothetical protein